MNQQPISQLRFKPCGLWRHDGTGISHRHQIVQAGRIEREGHSSPAIIHELLQSTGASDSADKLNPRIGADITYTEHRTKHTVLQEIAVERADDVPARRAAAFEIELEPSAVQIHRRFALLVRRGQSV